MRFLQYIFCCVILTPATGLCFLLFIKTTALQAGSLTLQETYRQQIFTNFWIVFYYKPYKVLLPGRKNTRQRWYSSLANILQEDTEILKQNLQSYEVLDVRLCSMSKFPFQSLLEVDTICLIFLLCYFQPSDGQQCAVVFLTDTFSSYTYG